jgi:uncharacterized protein
MVAVARGLAERGITTVTFDFPYMEAGRRIPDRPEVLEECLRRVLAAERKRTRDRLFVGGKSLGGRMASRVVAAGEAKIAGLLCLGYPLHPPGKPERLRTEHFARIRVPMLVVQGSRDAFGTPDELRPHLRSPECAVSLFVVQDGDHSFKVPARVKGAADVMAGILDAVHEWVRQPTRSHLENQSWVR